MFRRILVPLDGTTHADEALYYARSLAERTKAHLVLLRVQSLTMEDSERAVDYGELAHQAVYLRERGFEVNAAVESGAPEDVIPMEASEQHADLIVMARRPRGRLETLIRPSVTERVIAHSQVPVLVAAERIAGQSPATLLDSKDAAVIVPLDGSELAERALSSAVRFAQDYGRMILLVRVLPYVLLPGVGPQMYPMEPTLKYDEEHAALGYLSGVRRRLIHETGLTVHSLIRSGDPADEIVTAASAHPDSLLVMSTRGRGGFARFVLGSVATSVARHATVPVVIIPLTGQIGVPEQVAAAQVSATRTTASQ